MAKLTPQQHASINKVFKTTKVFDELDKHIDTLGFAGFRVIAIGLETDAGKVATSNQVITQLSKQLPQLGLATYRIATLKLEAINDASPCKNWGFRTVNGQKVRICLD